MATYCGRIVKVYERAVASSRDTSRNTSLIAGNSYATSTTAESETINANVKKDAVDETISSQIPYSPKNPRKKGYRRIPWINEIIDRGKVTVVNIKHGHDPIQTMIIDKSDTDKIRYPVRIDKDGYAINRGSPPTFVAHTVMGFHFDPSVDRVVDHVNKIKLDNRRKNLRLLTVRGNNLNHPCHKGNSTGIRGLNRDVYIDHDGNVRYQAYEAIIVNPRDPLTGPHHKAHQYRRKFYFGANGVTEADARKQGESWLNQMSKKFERERLDCMVTGSTTIPGMGVEASASK